MRPGRVDHKSAASAVRRAWRRFVDGRRRFTPSTAPPLQFTPAVVRFIASAWPRGGPMDTVRTSTTDVVSIDRTPEMLKNAESVFFLAATVAALALPAVPAVQEALLADYATVEAAVPTLVMEHVVIVAPKIDSPQQVAAVN
jgi:hypothetical protein